MTELGSVFAEPTGEGPPGRDLEYQVTVHRDQLGGPVKVIVPLRLAAVGGYAERRVNPCDEGETLKLSVPTDTPDGTTVRLRGMGEVGDGGRAGDLYIRVRIDESPSPGGALVPTGAGGLAPRWAGVALAAVGLGVLALLVALVVSLL